MNLLGKSLHYQQKVLPFVLVACTALFFLLLKIQTTHLQDVQLRLKQENVLNRFAAGPLDTTRNVVGEYTLTINQPVNPAAFQRPTDTLIYYPSREEYVPFQMLTALVEREGQVYQLTTYVSSVEITHLIIAVLAGQFVIYLILFIAILYINRKASNALWKPFYRTMEVLEKYDINSHQPVNLPKEVGVEEFNELNWTVNKLVERNRQAYRSQKEFVENASHEIQTPLAIIRSKVDLLMEQPDLDERSAELIGELAQANNRLSALNRTLILLSKIENAQYIGQTEVNFSQMVTAQLANVSRVYIDFTPTITHQIEENIHLNANPELLEILCSNLIRNAFIHNVPAGYVRVCLSGERVVVENSGKPLPVSPELLFERFRTGDPNSRRTLGLGLALVKQICLLYHYGVCYTHEGGRHRVEIIF